MDGQPRSGRSLFSAPSQERSSVRLPSARWSLQKTSVLAGTGSAGYWEDLAEVGSGTAEEASGWAGCPGSGLEAGGWCWLPGCQRLGSQGQICPHLAGHCTKAAYLCEWKQVSGFIRKN